MWTHDVLSEYLYCNLAAVARMPLYKLFVIEDQCDLKSGGAGSAIGQFAVSASDGAYNYGDEE